MSNFLFVLQSERYGRKSESKVETLTVSDVWFYYFQTSIVFCQLFCYNVRVKFFMLSAYFYCLSKTNLVQFRYWQSFSSFSSFEKFCVMNLFLKSVSSNLTSLVLEIQDRSI